MKWEPLGEILNGVMLWGATRADTTYCISWDEQFPQDQFRASWKVGDGATHHLPGGYENLRAAKRALNRIAN